MAVMSAPRRFVAAILLNVLAWPAVAAGPSISVEGGGSFVGGYFTLNDGTPAAFVEAVFDEHAISSSKFT